MKHPIRLLGAAVLLTTMLSACDGEPSDPRITLLSARLDDDPMHFEVLVDDEQREVVLGTAPNGERVAAVIDAEHEGVAIRDSEDTCTADALACELAEAAFDGELEALADEMGPQDLQFRRINVCGDFWFDDTGNYVCVTCTTPSTISTYCQGW